MSNFQVKLVGAFRNYELQEDKVVKRAFMTGFNDVEFQFRGQKYKYDFSNMIQKNLGTGKCRKIRPPHGWKAPAKQLVPKGKTMCLTVRPGQPGKSIMVNHPDAPGSKFAVNVPRSAKVGQKMLVPVPDVSKALYAGGRGSGRGRAGSGGGGGRGSSGGGGDVAKPEPEKGSTGWSTGTKVAAGAAAVGVGAAAGALGVYAAEHGVEETGEMLAAGAGDAADAIGEWVPDAAEAVVDWTEEAVADAGDWLEDAGEDIGDFVMDLF